MPPHSEVSAFSADPFGPLRVNLGLVVPFMQHRKSLRAYDGAFMGSQPAKYLILLVLLVFLWTFRNFYIQKNDDTSWEWGVVLACSFSESIFNDEDVGGGIVLNVIFYVLMVLVLAFSIRHIVQSSTFFMRALAAATILMLFGTLIYNNPVNLKKNQHALNQDIVMELYILLAFSYILSFWLQGSLTPPLLRNNILWMRPYILARHDLATDADVLRIIALPPCYNATRPLRGVHITYVVPWWCRKLPYMKNNTISYAGEVALQAPVQLRHHHDVVLSSPLPQVDELGHPCGYGEWRDSAWHGEHLMGFWYDAVPRGPFRSRETGSASGFVNLRVGYVRNRGEPLHKASMLPCLSEISYGIVACEVSTSGAWFRSLPALEELIKPVTLASAGGKFAHIPDALLDREDSAAIAEVLARTSLGSTAGDELAAAMGGQHSWAARGSALPASGGPGTLLGSSVSAETAPLIANMQKLVLSTGGTGLEFAAAATAGSCDALLDSSAVAMPEDGGKHYAAVNSANVGTGGDATCGAGGRSRGGAVGTAAEVGQHAPPSPVAIPGPPAWNHHDASGAPSLPMPPGSPLGTSSCAGNHSRAILSTLPGGSPVPSAVPLLPASCVASQPLPAGPRSTAAIASGTTLCAGLRKEDAAAQSSNTSLSEQAVTAALAQPEKAVRLLGDEAPLPEAAISKVSILTVQNLVATSASMPRELAQGPGVAVQLAGQPSLAGPQAGQHAVEHPAPRSGAGTTQLPSGSHVPMQLSRLGADTCADMLPAFASSPSQPTTAPTEAVSRAASHRAAGLWQAPKQQATSLLPPASASTILPAAAAAMTEAAAMATGAASHATMTQAAQAMAAAAATAAAATAQGALLDSAPEHVPWFINMLTAIHVLPRNDPLASPVKDKDPAKVPLMSSSSLARETSLQRASQASASAMSLQHRANFSFIKSAITNLSNAIPGLPTFDTPVQHGGARPGTFSMPRLSSPSLPYPVVEHSWASDGPLAGFPHANSEPRGGGLGWAGGAPNAGPSQTPPPPRPLSVSKTTAQALMEGGNKASPLRATLPLPASLPLPPLLGFANQAPAWTPLPLFLPATAGSSPQVEQPAGGPSPGGLPGPPLQPTALTAPVVEQHHQRPHSELAGSLLPHDSLCTSHPLSTQEAMPQPPPPSLQTCLSPQPGLQRLQQQQPQALPACQTTEQQQQQQSSMEPVPQPAEAHTIPRSLAQKYEALLFVHGLGTDLHKALRHYAQMMALANYPPYLAPIIFSWPSGVPVGYFFARYRAAEVPATGKALATTIQSLCDDGFSAVHLMVHSMGTRVLANALPHIERLVEPGPSKMAMEIASVIILNPDFGLDSFVSDVGPRLRRLCPRVTLYGDTADNALALSEFVNALARPYIQYRAKQAAKCAAATAGAAAQAANAAAHAAGVAAAAAATAMGNTVTRATAAFQQSVPAQTLYNLLPQPAAAADPPAPWLSSTSLPYPGLSQNRSTSSASSLPSPNIIPSFASKPLVTRPDARNANSSWRSASSLSDLDEDDEDGGRDSPSPSHSIRFNTPVPTPGHSTQLSSSFRHHSRRLACHHNLPSELDMMRGASGVVLGGADLLGFDTATPGALFGVPKHSRSSARRTQRSTMRTLLLRAMAGTLASAAAWAAGVLVGRRPQSEEVAAAAAGEDLSAAEQGVAGFTPSGELQSTKAAPKSLRWWQDRVLHYRRRLREPFYYNWLEHSLGKRIYSVRDPATGAPLDIDVVDISYLTANVANNRHTHFALNREIIDDIWEVVIMRHRAAERSSRLEPISANVYGMVVAPAFLDNKSL